MERLSRSGEMAPTPVLSLPAKDRVPTQQSLKVHYELSHSALSRLAQSRMGMECCVEATGLRLSLLFYRQPGRRLRALLGKG